MNNLKRIAIVLVVFSLLIVLSLNYTGNDVLKRAIVLGIGVDLEGRQVRVTVEIVSPGNGSEQVGLYSKTVSSTGKTVADALQTIAEKSGKETSLGQCVLLVYGESLIDVDFSSITDYFVKSDSFKSSAVVCCCEGSAEDFLNKGDALLKSVSLSVADKLKSQSGDVALPVGDLLTFARSQQELYRTGFLNYVQFESTPNTDSQNPDQEQGFFLCNRVAVFRSNKLLCVLSEEETEGFALLESNVAGNTFSVTEDDKVVTLRAGNKKLDIKQQNNVVTIDLQLFVRLARADSFGAGDSFSAKTDSEITESQKQQVKQQAVQLATDFLQKQAEWEFDLIGIHELFRRQYGTTEDVNNIPMSQLQFDLSVSVSEK